MCSAILHRWLAAVFSCCLIAAPVLAMQGEASCNAYDFRPYWHSVLKAQLIGMLSASKGTEQEVKGAVPYEYWVEARSRTDVIVARFSALLKTYPEFCELKKLKPSPQASALFVTLAFEIDALIIALERKQLSARYLSETAIARPHFTANLLGHLHLLGDLTHTLEVSEEQLEYFSRIKNSLLKGDSVSHKALLVYSQAFTHLVLLINEGQPDEFLDRYSRILSELKEHQFDHFLELGQLTTDRIATFLLKLKLNIQKECHLHYMGRNCEKKHWVCGNVAFVVDLNGTLDRRCWPGLEGEMIIR